MEEINLDLIKRLNIIINLMLDSNKDKITQREKIEKLSLMGLQPKEIANILNRKGHDIRSELAKIKKQKGGKK